MPPNPPFANDEACVKAEPASSMQLDERDGLHTATAAQRGAETVTEASLLLSHAFAPLGLQGVLTWQGSGRIHQAVVQLCPYACRCAAERPNAAAGGQHGRGCEGRGGCRAAGSD